MKGNVIMNKISARKASSIVKRILGNNLVVKARSISFQDLARDNAIFVDVFSNHLLDKPACVKLASVSYEHGFMINLSGSAYPISKKVDTSLIHP
jgi:hypothetical protein